ncbi:hypothetical protein DFH29DRAFT_994252 [Suillus ampliporus]|nr:hypothetical protein DFH29DRAFT_994252 [Suillus ampliporus]
MAVASLHEELEEIQCSAICITESVPDADVAAAIQTTTTSLSASSPSASSSSSSLFASASPSASSVSISPSSALSLSLFASASPPASASFSVSPSASVSAPVSTTPHSPHVLLRAGAGQGDHVIHITAPDAMQAAESFLALCNVWCLEGSNSQLVFPDDIEITNGMPLNLIIGSIDATISYGYSGHWQLMSEGYNMPIVTSLPPCDKEIISFCAYSLIIHTGLILGMELLPISPHLLVYLLDGYQASTAHPFLDAISPMTSQQLHSWPPPSVISPSTGCRELDITPAHDPYSLILEVDGMIQINQLHHLSEAAQTDLGQRLVCHMVFGNETPLAHGLHAVYVSLESAFQYVIHDDMKFCDYFHVNSSVQPIPQEMFADRILTSPQQVIDIICPEPIAQYSLPLRRGYNPNLDYITFAEQFIAHLKCYLHSQGTPHATDGSVLFEEGSSSDDVVYRSHLFLRSATAHEVLPVDATQCIKIKFDLHWEHSWGTAIGIHTHTCFYNLDILLDEGTASIISQAIPEDNSQTTDFD